MNIIKGATGISIGIDASNKRHINGGWIVESDKKPKNEHYGIMSHSYGVNTCTLDHEKIYNGIEQPLSNIDVVKFTMELTISSNDESTLKYVINDIDQGKAFENMNFDVDLQYNLAIGLGRDTEIELIDFHRKFL